MSFRPDALGGGEVGLPGEVDYRLARQTVLSEFRRGRLSRLDVCDAQPELLRNARELGRLSGEECPICEEPTLVQVTYVFGSNLPPAGRCISRADELARMNRARARLTGYVVEVCPECSWNHLNRAFLLGRLQAG
jgi:hypothetical protein